MVTHYSKTLLIRFLHLYHTHPEQLTEHEQQIAERICSCALCDNVWLRRRKKLPQRCPLCHKHSWNRPLLEAMKAKDEAASAHTTAPHVDASTSPKKGDTP
jgi:hypothetical protein